MDYNKLPAGKYIYLLLYVNDMLIASKSISAINKLKDLSSEFEMNDLGEANKVLGIKIERDRDSCKVSSKRVFEEGIAEVQHQWRYEFCKHTIGFSFQVKSYMSPTSVEEREYTTHVPYASAVDNLMYAMMCTRPDLSQAISMVSRYMHEPGRGH